MSKIYERLEYYAEHAGNNPAFTYRVSDKYESVSYFELKDQVDALAASLWEYKSKTIAIIGHNKLEYAVSLLAVLCHIGDAFLIDKELKKEDIENIFARNKPDLILIDDELELFFDEYRILRFSDVRRMMRTGLKYEYDAVFAGRLILHTSGTTGEPKCVLLKEENYYGVIPELNRKWEVRSEHSVLYIIPLYHIYALMSLFHGLYAGSNNILEWDYKRISRVLAETKPHLFMGVPLMYNRIRDAALAKAGWKLLIAVKLSNLLMKCKIDIRKKLFREIYAYFGGNYVFGVSAGSILPYRTGKFFKDIGLPVYNVYGMTETSGPIAINYKEHNRFDSVGEILDVNEVKIIDADENGIGHVCVRGSNVFDGYLKKREENVFNGDYFDTGDLGYIREGYLYVIGREKDILIGANGKNIASAELSGKMLECPEIHDCKVIMENNRLIAIVNTDLSEEELKKYLDKVNSGMPNYKRISDFHIAKKIK